MDFSSRNELLRAAISHEAELSRFLRGKVRDPGDAQDLLQELYVAVLRVQRDQEVRHAKAYLFAIAANLVFQHRKRARARPCFVSMDEVPIDVLQCSHLTLEMNAPETAAVLGERVAHLTARLRKLDPKVQAALVWHHRDGFTCDEIAARLEVVGNRVKKYLVKGLAHCRG